MARRKWSGRRVVMALALTGGIVNEAPRPRRRFGTTAIKTPRGMTHPIGRATCSPAPRKPSLSPRPSLQPVDHLAVRQRHLIFEIAGSLTFNANYTLQSGALSLGISGGPITTAASTPRSILSW